ncbi:MAG: HD domain-containing protein [Chloroflexi bacterium]|nr:HD domain-containing protein [Chloroflexota bacterium]
MYEAPSISLYTALTHAMRFPPVVQRLAAFFTERCSAGASIDAYLVGGVIRDTIMGRAVYDIDIVVNRDAYAVGSEIANALGGNCVRLHYDWQIARVAVSDGSAATGIVDVATYQGELEQELRRRDFTINALGLPINAAVCDEWQDCLLDPCGGLCDLRDGVVRMVSAVALDEDLLRLLRGARLAAQFGFTLESETSNAIKERANRINEVAQERVRDELMRLLGTLNAYEGVRLLDEVGLLCAVLPELDDSRGVTQPKEHYWDVLNHQIETVRWVDAMFDDENDGYESDDENDIDPSLLSKVPRFTGMYEHFAGEVSDGFDRLAFLKLTALLHDVAKPATRTVEDSGRIRFLGHHSEGAEMVRSMLTRLRFGKRGVEHVAGMVQHHLRPRMLAARGELPTKRALYRYYRDVGDVALDTLYLNTADYMAMRGPMIEQDDWDAHCRLIRHILHAGSVDGGITLRDSAKTLPKLVSGYDIMDKFTLEPGPRIGVLLEGVREAQASGEVSSKEQALELVRASLERGGNGA